MIEEGPNFVHSSRVLAAYVEAIVRGRRVVVFGDATSGLAEELAERGARLVHAYDPDPARAAEALARVARPARGLAFAALSDDLGVRDGAFDVAVVPDLSLFSDAEALVRRARRAVSSTGIAVIASPNPDAKRRLMGPSPVHTPLGYYELYDLVSLQFAKVRMAGQAPFVGYAIAALAEAGDIAVTVDTSLLERSEEPELFVALAGERPVTLDPYAVIEVPLEAVPFASAERLDNDDLHAEKAELEARFTLVSLELERAGDRVRDEVAKANELAQRVTILSTQNAELAQQLEVKEGRLREIDSRAGDSHVRAERLAHDNHELEEELARQRDRATRLSKQLDDDRRTRQKLEVELGMLRARPDLAGAKDRLDASVRELAERDRRIAELEALLAAKNEEPVTLRLPAGRISELEDALRDAQLQNEALAAEKAVEEERVRDLSRSLAEVTAERDAEALRVAALAGEVEGLKRAATDLRDTLLNEAEAGRTAEIDALEQALVERGRAIAGLQKDLHEAERVGRDLVQELSARERVALGAEPSELDELTRRLDTLAASAARSEAELVTARLRVTELSRKLEDAERASPPNSAGATAHAELEAALVAAHRELAELRAALAAETARGEGLAAAASAQSALLHQVAGGS